jgi:hypothetical protein
VPCFQQLRRKAGVPETGEQPLRQRARFEPDPRQREGLPPRSQAISASGSLTTFASTTIFPVPSTTQTLERSNDTSIPT